MAEGVGTGGRSAQDGQAQASGCDLSRRLPEALEGVGSMLTSLLPLLPLLPLGLLAGLLSGLLGIGGGLIFSPLLLLVGLEPHQALATSTLAIVPTTAGGTWAHWRSRQLPLPLALVIGAAAAFSGLLFSHRGSTLPPALLLGLQALMYLLLVLTMAPRPAAAAEALPAPVPPLGLVLVGSVAGLASGLLGVGGGLVMVPLMVRCLTVPIQLAIRLSTLAVLVSASVSSCQFLADGRAQWPVALVLGVTAALGARWSAARLDRVPERWLVHLLRLLSLLLALDSGRRALMLVWAVAPA